MRAGRSARVRSRPGPLLAAAIFLLVPGCVYFNSLYNARRAFEGAQEARLRARPQEAATGYLEAIDKAARSFRSDRDGRWADDALYIMGRAYYHGGDWERSRGALEQLLRISADSALRTGARVHLAGAELAGGARESGLRRLDEALPAVRDPVLRAEAHLWRARAVFDAGRLAEGWASLEQSEEASTELRMQVGLERLSRGLANNDFARARGGSVVVLEEPTGEPWADTLFAAAERAEAIWGAERAAQLLAAGDRSPWTPRARARAGLLRARLLARSGDSLAATALAEEIAQGSDRVAHEARVALARWRLRSIGQVGGLDEVRAILLPALALPEAVRLLDLMKHVALFAERAAVTTDHLALFAGAELARDSLGAPALARQLFTLYADRDSGSAWEAKALMAALDLTTQAADREALATRLERMGASLYIQASQRNLPRPTDYALVEGRLRSSLAILHQRIAAEALNRDVAVAQTARILDSVRVAGELARRLEAGDSILRDSLRRAAPGATSTDDFFARDTILLPDTVQRNDTASRRDTIPRSRSRIRWEDR